PSCHAAYKLAIKFVNWNKERQHFYHPFQRYETVRGFPIGEWWLKLKDTYDLGQFDYACFVVPALCDQKKSPRFLDGTVFDTKVHDQFRPERAFQQNVLMDLKIQYPYAYHFNAALLANFLCDFAKKRGVRQILDDVTHIQVGPTGNIEYVKT